MPTQRTSVLLAALMASAMGHAASAQAPFDMSPERSGGVESHPAGIPATPLAPAGGTPIQSIAPAPSTEPPVPPPSATPPKESFAAAGAIGRYIIPGHSLRFEGEMGRHAWGVVLTGEQAAHARTLTVAYNSSIYVAPENSRLRVTVNDRLVIDEPLAAHESADQLNAEVPAGTFRAGTNVVSFSVVQRHRTDCTIQSTYELWTEVDGAGTGIIFDIKAPGGFVGLDDLGAVGFDAGGATNIRLIVPAGAATRADEELLKLVQAATIRGNYQQPLVTIAGTALSAPAPGTLQIAAGTFAEVAAAAGALDQTRTSQVGFVETATGGPLLVVAGADRSQLSAAIDYVVAGAEPPRDMTRTAIDTTPWLLPIVPMLTGRQQLSFVDLGIPTEEFSGRRFHTEFRVGLPDDFFAEAYGEATILLDAAYAADVKPGSHIDIYANGFVAANVPLTSRSGDIFRHLPIKVPLAHFRPGVNRVTLEAVLDAEADAACAPGAPAGGSDHFALFDTSTFQMPDFGRVGRWPNLAAFAGTGSPYGGSGTPVQVVFGRQNDTNYGAAATLLSLLARSAGRMVPAIVGHAESLGGGPAIFAGALDDFTAPTLATFGIDDAARTTWINQPAVEVSGVAVDIAPGGLAPQDFGDAVTTRNIYDHWRKDVINPGGIRGTWVAFEGWLERTFDLSLSSLSLTGAADAPFNPARGSTILIAQTPASANRDWTMVAAPTSDDLASGLAAVTAGEFWPTIAGRVATFAPAIGVENVRAESERYIVGGGFSLQGLRLFVANWLSINIVTYALALVVLCSILGICTSALLSRLGRNA